MMSSWDLEQLTICLVDMEECSGSESPYGPDWTCDGTLRRTREWLDEHGLRQDVNLPLLAASDAHCDCTVLLHAGPSDWPPQREALLRVLEAYTPEQRAIVLEFYEEPEEA